jgi:hypothetical protein
VAAVVAVIITAAAVEQVGSAQAQGLVLPLARIIQSRLALAVLAASQQPMALLVMILFSAPLPQQAGVMAVFQTVEHLVGMAAMAVLAVAAQEFLLLHLVQAPEEQVILHQ